MVYCPTRPRSSVLKKIPRNCNKVQQAATRCNTPSRIRNPQFGVGEGWFWPGQPGTMWDYTGFQALTNGTLDAGCQMLDAVAENVSFQAGSVCA